MPDPNSTTRRDVLKVAGMAGAAGLATLTGGSVAKAQEAPGKVYRIGVVSAAILGKPQPRNGHTWHFAQYFHPTFDFDAFKKHYPQALPSHVKYYRNPAITFGELPFPDTRITHYYDADPAVAVAFTEVFPGVKVAKSLEEMVQEVDAVWMGDASGLGEDHFDLVAPGLAKGLPTFCDKPIGGTVAGTRKILDFAREAPRHRLCRRASFGTSLGMEAALRMRDAGTFGPIEFITATLHSRYSLPGWMIYGQHPVWTAMTLMGPGVDSVSMYEYKDTCHALITWPDRFPAHVWFGEPYERFEYCRTDVHFKKKHYMFTPSIEGDFEYGHHYEMFRMAAEFRKMVKTGVEPVPHQEILEVTAIVYAGAESLAGKKAGLCKLAEFRWGKRELFRLSHLCRESILLLGAKAGDGNVQNIPAVGTQFYVLQRRSHLARNFTSDGRMRSSSWDSSPRTVVACSKSARSPSCSSRCAICCACWAARYPNDPRSECADRRSKMASERCSASSIWFKMLGVSMRKTATNSRKRSKLPPVCLTASATFSTPSSSASARALERTPGTGRQQYFRRPSCTTATKSFDLVVQERSIDRFRNVTVHSRVQASLAIPFHGVGRHGDDRHVRRTAAFFFQLANNARRRKTVHHWHLDIHQELNRKTALQKHPGRLTIAHDRYARGPAR